LAQPITGRENENSEKKVIVVVLWNYGIVCHTIMLQKIKIFDLENKKLDLLLKEIWDNHSFSL